MSRASERLRERAHEYELNAAAASERGDETAANGFHVVELTLRELADVLEEGLEAA